ncbi:MAG: ribonuclease T [Gammaproteobacteria bacterium]|nr:MAG: ribonuclease T [Gammaproteobacteria bacterium]RTZ72223.1 MAG: ribonuclease T [Gammaproteobacteria bacterium]
MNQATRHPTIDQRFRGFLPVVVDVETAGFNAATDALLEIAAVVIEMDEAGFLHPGHTVSCHVEPFEGANLDPKALEFNGIDPWHPFRMALPEREALQRIFTPVRQAVKKHNCRRAILVGHNAFFDLGFLNAAVERTGLKRNPFHPFSTFDTVSLAGLVYGQTVLARAVVEAGIEWDSREAHSALYDTEKTAELFCAIVNRWQELTLLEQRCHPAEESPPAAEPQCH